MERKDRGRRQTSRNNSRKGVRYDLTSREKAEITYLHAKNRHVDNIQHVFRGDRYSKELQACVEIPDEKYWVCDISLEFFTTDIYILASVEKPSIEEMCEEFRTGIRGKLNRLWSDATNHMKRTDRSASQYYYELTQKQSERSLHPLHSQHRSHQSPQQRDSSGSSSSRQGDRSSHSRQNPHNSSCNATLPLDRPSPLARDVPMAAASFVSSSQNASRSPYYPPPHRHPHTGFGEHGPTANLTSPHNTLVKPKRPSQQVYNPPIPGREVQLSGSNRSNTWNNSDSVGLNYGGDAYMGGNTRGGNRNDAARRQAPDDWGLGEPAGGNAINWNQLEDDWTEDQMVNRGQTQAIGVNKQGYDQRDSQGIGYGGEKDRPQRQESIVNGQRFGGSQEVNKPVQQQPSGIARQTVTQKITPNLQESEKALIANGEQIIQQIQQSVQKMNMGQGEGQKLNPSHHRVEQNQQHSSRHSGPTMIPSGHEMAQYQHQNQQRTMPNQEQNGQQRTKYQQKPYEQIPPQYNKQNSQKTTTPNQYQQQVQNTMYKKEDKPMMANTIGTGTVVRNPDTSSRSSTPEPGELKRIPSQEFEIPSYHNKLCVGQMLQDLKDNQHKESQPGQSKPVEDINNLQILDSKSTQRQAEGGLTAWSVDKPIKPITILKRSSVSKDKEGQSEGQSESQNKGETKQKVPEKDEAEDSLNAIDLSEYFPSSASHLDWAEEVSEYLPPTPTGQESMVDGPFKVTLNLKSQEKIAVSDYVPPPVPQNDEETGKISEESALMNRDADITKDKLLQGSLPGMTNVPEEKAHPNHLPQNHGQIGPVIAESVPGNRSNAKNVLEYVPPSPLPQNDTVAVQISGDHAPKRNDTYISKEELLQPGLPGTTDVPEHVLSQNPFPQNDAPIGPIIAESVPTTRSDAENVLQYVPPPFPYNDTDITPISADLSPKSRDANDSKDELLQGSLPVIANASEYISHPKALPQMKTEIGPVIGDPVQINRNDTENVSQYVSRLLPQNYGETGQINENQASNSKNANTLNEGLLPGNIPVAANVPPSNLLPENAGEMTPNNAGSASSQVQSPFPQNVTEIGSISGGSVSGGRHVNTSKAELILQSVSGPKTIDHHAKINSNKGNNTSVISDPWSTQYGLTEVNKSLAPGSYPAASPGDSYSAWIEGNSGYNPGIEQTAASSMQKHSSAPGSYQGPANPGSRPSGHYPGWEDHSMNPVTHQSTTQFPQDRGGHMIGHQRQRPPIEPDFRQTGPANQMRHNLAQEGMYSRENLQGFPHGYTSNNHHPPPQPIPHHHNPASRHQLTGPHNTMGHSAVSARPAAAMPDARPGVHHSTGVRHGPGYSMEHHQTHAYSTSRESPTGSGDGGSYYDKKLPPASKSHSKGIRKINIAGNLVSRDDAVPIVEQMIESACRFTTTKPKARPSYTEADPQTETSVSRRSTDSKHPLKKRVSFEGEGENKENLNTHSPRSPVDLIDVPIVFKKAPVTPSSGGKTTPVSERKPETKRTEATPTKSMMSENQNSPRSPVDLIDVPIVFKKAPATPSGGGKTTPVSERKPDTKRTEATTTKSMMSVARRTMEEAVTRKKKQAPKVIWTKISEAGNMGQFFVNRVYFDQGKTRWWQPDHLKQKHTKVLGFQDVVSFTGLERALVVNSSWAGNVIDRLVNFPENTNLTLVCPKRSGDSPLHEEAHEIINTPFLICRTHRDSMGVSDGMLLEPSCTENGCTDRRQITLIHPYKSSNCHSNFYLLRYPDRLRLVVFSGELNSLNWEKLGQFGWYADLPIDNTETGAAADGETTQEKHNDTEKGEAATEISGQLLSLLLRLGVTEVTLSEIFKGARFNSLSPYVRLVTSCPGSHVKADSTEFGIPRLKNILKGHPALHMQGEVQKICQTTKLGTGQGLQQLKELLNIHDGFHKRKDHRLSIVYPSKKFIQRMSGKDAEPTQEELSLLFSNGDKTCISGHYLCEPSSLEDLVVPHANILLSFQPICEVSQEEKKLEPSDLSVKGESPALNSHSSAPVSQTQSISSEEPQDSLNPDSQKPALNGSERKETISPETELQSSAANVDNMNAKVESSSPEVETSAPKVENSAPKVENSAPEVENSISSNKKESAKDAGKSSEVEMHDGKSEAAKHDGKSDGAERHYGWMFIGSQTVGYGSWGGFKAHLWNFTRFELGVGLFTYMDEEKNEVHALDLSGLGFLCDYSRLVPYVKGRVPYTPLHAWTKDAHKFYRCIGLAARSLPERGKSGKAVFIDFFKEDDPLVTETDFEHLSGVRSAIMRAPLYRGPRGRHQTDVFPRLGSVVEFVCSVGERGVSTDTGSVVHTFRDKVEAMKYYGIDPSKYTTEDQDSGSSRDNWRKKPETRVAERKREDTYEDQIHRLGLRTDEDVDSYWEKRFQDIHVATKVNKALPHLNPKTEKIDCRVTSIETDLQFLEKSAQFKGHGRIPKSLMGVFCVDVMQRQMDGHMARFLQGRPSGSLT